MSEVLQVDSYGPIFELEAPHTVESVKSDAGASEREKRPLLCRLRHKRRVIGRTYLPSDDPLTSMLALIAEGSSGKTLVRCERCRKIEIRSGA